MNTFKAFHEQNAFSAIITHRPGEFSVVVNLYLPGAWTQDPTAIPIPLLDAAGRLVELGYRAAGDVVPRKGSPIVMIKQREQEIDEVWEPRAEITQAREALENLDFKVTVYGISA